MGALGYRLKYCDYLLRQRLGGRYVFIHINKCGGTSVEAALGIPVKIHDPPGSAGRSSGGGAGTRPSPSRWCATPTAG